MVFQFRTGILLFLNYDLTLTGKSFKNLNSSYLNILKRNYTFETFSFITQIKLTVKDEA